MTDADRCFEAGCNRGIAASVTRDDLPGPLRLCATHTEQFRQSSEGWIITWPPGDPEPTVVTAPSSDVLWDYRPTPPSEPVPVPGGDDAVRPGLFGLPGRAAGWAKRSGGRRPPK